MRNDNNVLMTIAGSYKRVTWLEQLIKLLLLACDGATVVMEAP